MVGARSLRILLYTRADAERNAGGDLIEAHRLREGLNAAGHEAVVGRAGGDHGTDWDVVHLFNIDRAAELAVFLEQHQWFPGARVVLAPVFSPSLHTHTEPLARLVRPITNLGFSSIKPSRFMVPGLAARALRGRVDALHFHTEAEERNFKSEYPGFTSLSTTIPPPVDPPDNAVLKPIDVPVAGAFLVCIGRIEPLKNQIWLLKSGISRVLPIVFAGPLNPKRALYCKRFTRLVQRTANCHWLGHLDQTQIRQLLERATAHILPSRRENFGLATLEALDAGCEAIVPSHHFIVGELAEALHSFDLGDPTTLQTAVSSILDGSRRAPGFRCEPYTVTAATNTVLKLYRTILV